MTVKKIFKKKAFLIPMWIVLGIALVVALFFRYYSPYYRSAEYIESYIEDHLPIGTDKAEVLAWLAEEPELYNITESDSGYSRYFEYTLPIEEQRIPIGVSSVSAKASFRVIFWNNVYVYIGFDENDRLIAVDVDSGVDIW